MTIWFKTPSRLKDEGYTVHFNGGPSDGYHAWCGTYGVGLAYTDDIKKCNCERCKRRLREDGHR